MVHVLTFLAALSTALIPVVYCGKGAIQYRISEAEFSKVSKILLSTNGSFVAYSGENSLLISGNTSTGLFNLTQLRINPGQPTSVTISIPKDDHLVAMTTFANMGISGYFTINRLCLFIELVSNNFDPCETPSHSASHKDQSMSEKFELNVHNVSIQAEGKVEPIGVFGLEQHIILRIPHCSVTALTFDLKSLPAFVTQLITEEELEHIFKDTICDMFYIKFSLGFEVVPIRIEEINLDMFAHAVHLQIKNSTIMITLMLKLSDGSSSSRFPINSYDIPTFPPLRENSEPFEIWINEDIFLDVWGVYKHKAGIGIHPHTLSDLVPLGVLNNLDNIDTGKVPYMFPLYDTYPNATGQFYVYDADVGIRSIGEKIHVFFNVSGNFIVTLNCDRNRTYSAFNFSMFVYVPTQVASDNKFITFKLYGFGGNLTIINSSIGHVANRHLSVLLHNLPQLFDPSTVFENINEKINGMAIKHLLPTGLYLQRNSIAIEQDNIVFSGSLTDKDPDLQKIPRKNLTWTGHLTAYDEMFLPLHDLTPNVPTPPEKNCTVPKKTSYTSGKDFVKSSILLITTMVLLMVSL